MQEKTSIPIPSAIRELITANNELLQKYQQELTTRVISANLEMMQLLGLNPDDGWRIDMSTMMYVKEEPKKDTE